MEFNSHFISLFHQDLYAAFGSHFSSFRECRGKIDKNDAFVVTVNKPSRPVGCAVSVTVL